LPSIPTEQLLDVGNPSVGEKIAIALIDQG
jgi:hypothetical protein